MKVSVIIPTFGTPEFLKECVASIKNAEIIVGIDACRKTLKSIDASYKGIRVFYSEENIGPYAIKNSLSQFAKDKIIFFDSDDLMEPDMVEDYLNSDCDVTRFAYTNFGDTTSTRMRVAEGVIGIKKEIFERFKFQEWRCAADSEFLQRLEYNKVKIGRSNKVSFKRRLHENNLTRHKRTNMSSGLRADYALKIEEKFRNKEWPNPILGVHKFHEVSLT